MNLIIKRVSLKRSDSIINFVMEYRKKLFPMLSSTMLPMDLQNFKTVYLNNKLSTFFVALDRKNQIAGTIGMLQYDNRFPQFNYNVSTTCEVVKLFVAPQYRGMGLATRLISSVAGFAKQQQVERLYLHTHPFLQGAREVWEKSGFKVTLQEDIPVWNTIHMEYKLF